MLRRLQAFLVLGVWLVAAGAAAQESTDEPASEDRPSAPASAAAAPEASTPKESAAKPEAEAASPPSSPKAAPPPTPEAKPGGESEGFRTFVSGYFRAPLAIGISPRPDPNDLNGPTHTQLSYGPNRTVDSSYYSFAYTRLQEQDWAEVFIHTKKKHVEAVVGWMGYWYQSAGFRNPDASWVPGMAYLTLDSDVGVGGLKPNVALTAGAWWPKFGYF